MGKNRGIFFVSLPWDSRISGIQIGNFTSSQGPLSSYVGFYQKVNGEYVK